MEKPTIAELESFFASAKLPATYTINAGEKVADVSKMIQSHLRVIKANPGSKANDAFIARLIKLKEAIEQA